MRSLTVGRLMRRDPATLDADATVAEFRKAYPLGSRHMVILTDTGGRYAGLVPTAEAHAPELNADASTRLVRTLARWRHSTLTPELDVKAAMSTFDRAEAETLCVIEAGGEGRVVGLLTEAYASRRYAEELDKANRSLSGEES